MLANGARSYVDRETKVPFLIADSDQWFSYDDVDSIKTKVEEIEIFHKKMFLKRPILVELDSAKPFWRCIRLDFGL